MKITSYNKLVRDKIPEIIQQTGKRPIIENLDSESHKKYLDEKLCEKLKEYTASDSIDELADLVEVVYAILKYKGVDITDFENIRREKVDKCGAFNDRILLKKLSKNRST